MSRSSNRYRASVRHGRLRQSGQRVKFSQNRDHRLALAVAGDESGRLVRYARLDAEARVFQLALEQRRTLLFVIPQLRVSPDLLRDLAEFGRSLIDPLFKLAMCLGCLAERRTRKKKK